MNDALPPTLDLDAHLVQVLEDYLAARASGTAPPKQELLAEYPELAEQLDACLASLDFIRRATADAAPTRSSARFDPERRQEILGAYRLGGEIGRGGMGIVYQAERVSDNQRVALKVLPFAAALDPRQLQRFKNEAQAAALLHHPHIVPVLDVGCAQDVHFYVMELIQGRNLASVVEQLTLQRYSAGEEGGKSLEGKPFFLPSPLGGEGPGVRGQGLAAVSQFPLTPAPSPPRGEGSRQKGRDAEKETGKGKEIGKSGVSASADAPFLAFPSFSVASPTVLAPAFFQAVARLGMQAAEALEHAHQVGIIHRDIKPANLLVDEQAQLWVTDFGLARFLDETGLTMTGDVLGTLRYMSPEQALARRGIVDQRTDIYSLGVTLYELLTLRPAFAGRDREDLLRRIAEEEPTPPRRLNPALPRDLETIIQKASAKCPTDRYFSAGELAEDLRRFLAGQPIQARRPSLLQQARQWARRHKNVVAAAALVGVVAIVALALGTFFIAQERDRTRRREQQARKAVDEMYTEVAQRWWAQQPYMEQVQREFLLKALHFYEDFARETSASNDLLLEMAKAARRVGDIQQRLGEQGKAAEAYARALAQLERLDDFPRSLVARDERAQAHNNLGNLWHDRGRLDAAEQAYRTAHDLFASLTDADSSSDEYRDGLAGSMANLGMVLHTRGQPHEAEKVYRAALDSYIALARDYPDVPAYRHAQAGVRNNLANLLRDTGRPREALLAYEEALALWRALETESPALPIFRQAQASSYSGRGIVLAALGRLTEAEKAQRRSLALRERLLADYPSVPAYRQALAASRHSLGRLLAGAGRPQEALAQFDEALALRRRLKSDSPGIPAYRQELADSLYGRGYLLVALGRYQEADTDLHEALTLRQELATESTQVPENRSDLARSERALGELFRQRGLPQEAERAYEAALVIDAQLVADCPQAPAYRLEWAATRNQLGALLQDSHRYQEAEAAYRGAISLLQQLAENSPSLPYYQHELVASFRQMSKVLENSGRAEEAEQTCSQAIVLAEELVDRFPGFPEYRGSCADALSRLGGLLLARGQTREAEQTFRRAEGLLEKAP